MPDPLPILEAVAFSAGAAALIVLLLGWPWRAPNRVRTQLGGALAVGAGIYTGCWTLGVSPNWPPREDQDRLLFFLLPAVIAVEALSTFSTRPRWLPWLLRLAVAGSAAPILLYRSTYVSDLTGAGSREWTPVQMTLILGGLAMLLAAEWDALWLLLMRPAGKLVPVMLALVCAGASVTVMLSGYASGGQIGLTFFGALAGAAVASFALGGSANMNGVLGIGVVGLFALLIMGRFFGQLSTTNAALLFCAPLLAWGAELRIVERGGAIAQGVARVLLPAVVVGVALLLAQRQFVADSNRGAAGANEPSADDYLNLGK